MPPDPPENVTVRALTIFVVVTWHLYLDPDWEDDPQGPRTTFHLEYRPEDSQTWRQLPSHISPTQVRKRHQAMVLNASVRTVQNFSFKRKGRVCGIGSGSCCTINCSVQFFYLFLFFIMILLGNVVWPLLFIVYLSGKFKHLSIVNYSRKDYFQTKIWFWYLGF